MSHEMPSNGGAPQEQAPQKESVLEIRLNSDPEIQNLLRNKMEEYRQRSDQAVAQGGMNMDAVYKYLVIETLFAHNMLNVSELYDRLSVMKQPDSVKEDFWNAVNVVDQYNKGSMDRLKRF